MLSFYRLRAIGDPPCLAAGGGPEGRRVKIMLKAGSSVGWAREETVRSPTSSSPVGSARGVASMRSTISAQVGPRDPRRRGRGTRRCARRAWAEVERGAARRAARAANAHRGRRRRTRHVLRHLRPESDARDVGVAERVLHDGLHAGRTGVVGAQRRRAPARATGSSRSRARAPAVGARRAPACPPSVTASPRRAAAPPRRSPPRPPASAATAPARARARRRARCPATNSIVGHSMTRTPPSTQRAVGRVCWRSTRSVRSTVANGSSSSELLEQDASPRRRRRVRRRPSPTARRPAPDRVSSGHRSTVNSLEQRYGVRAPGASGPPIASATALRIFTEPQQGATYDRAARRRAAQRGARLRRVLPLRPLPCASATATPGPARPTRGSRSPRSAGRRRESVSARSSRR